MSLFFLFPFFEISTLKLWAEGLIGITIIFYFIMKSCIISKVNKEIQDVKHVLNEYVAQ